MIYSPLELQEKLFELCGKCYKSDQEYVKAKESLDMLEDFKKVIFEEIVESIPGDKSNYKERQARISKQWKDWLENYQVIRRAEADARVLRDKNRRDWETCRSLLSAIKKEMEAIPYQK
jgi:hypothetical protein